MLKFDWLCQHSGRRNKNLAHVTRRIFPSLPPPPFSRACAPRGKIRMACETRWSPAHALQLGQSLASYIAVSLSFYNIIYRYAPVRAVTKSNFSLASHPYFPCGAHARGKGRQPRMRTTRKYGWLVRDRD